MNHLSKSHIQKIKEQLLQDGITDPDLLNDLIDHYCCIVEEEMDQGLEINQAIQLAYDKVCPDGAGEIQRETNYLLNYKSIIIMRILMYSLGFLSAFVFTFGWMFKIFHLPGGAILSISAGFIFTAGFLPVYIIMQVRDKNKKTTLEWFTYISGAIVAAVLSLGAVFKLNHLAGANIMTMVGMLALALTFLPSLFLLLYKRSEQKMKETS